MRHLAKSMFTQIGHLTFRSEPLTQRVLMLYRVFRIFTWNKLDLQTHFSTVVHFSTATLKIYCHFYCHDRNDNNPIKIGFTK